jgi:hypothetical protein
VDPDTRDQLSGAERFDDVVVQHELRATQPVVFVSREEQHRHGRALAKFARQVESIPLSEVRIEDRDFLPLSSQ